MKRYLLAGTSALALLMGAAGADATTFTYSGAVVSYTIPTTGTYDIAAAGAEGGASAGTGGLGALAGGEASLTAGTVPTSRSVALAGPAWSMMRRTGGGAAAGGGGSFVYMSTPTLSPLVGAGGGGGGG